MSINSNKLIETDAGFEGGQNSSLDPVKLGAGSYVFATNMLNRGGSPQTRPGFTTAYVLPDGNFQGHETFIPRRGRPQQVSVVEGNIYVSDYPYKTYRRAPGATLSPTARFSYFCNATQSVRRNADNSLSTIAPKNLLLIQDGEAPPVYWDGATVTRSSGAYSIPQGTHMLWTGDRLWVARDNQLFAGDIGDPTSSYEQTYNLLGGMQSFFLPGKISGLSKVPGATFPTLLAFTDTTTSSFRADIRTRSLWFTTDDFQKVVLPTVGCVAHRSIAARAGMLYWFSAQGATSLDSAQFSMVNTRIAILDQEVSRSKENLSHDLSGMAAAHYENLFLLSVPEGGRANRHTWVHDASPVANSLGATAPAWASVWTGVRPVQWASIVLDGREHLFCASKDLDGKNRVYQAFCNSRKDNGVDIPWSIETRAVTGGTAGLKQLRDVELSLSEVLGQLDLRIQWAGPTRGRWKTCGTGVFHADAGSINAGEIITSTTQLFACKKQSRILRSNDVLELPSDSLTSDGIESPFKESIDQSFQLRISGSGQCAIRIIRVFMDIKAEPTSGEVSKMESENKFVRFDGAAADNLGDLNASPERYTAEATADASYRGFRTIASVSVSSPISASDAEKRAGQLAQARADYKLMVGSPPYVGSKWAFADGGWRLR